MPTYEHDRERRLATIMAADIVGYSRLMDSDEEGTYTALLSARSELIEPGIEEHKGRIVKHTGDGFLAEFPTVMSAIHFAMSLQEEMGRRMAEVPVDRQIKFRIGVNLGDIIIDETGDIFGDGVNVAARLEPLAIPGGICISGPVYESIHKKLDAEFNDLGPQSVKNISTPVHAFDIRWPGEAGKPEERAVKAAAKSKPVGLVVGSTVAAAVIIGIVLWFVKPFGVEQATPENSIAVLPFVNMSADPEQDYFSDGIAEELLNILSGVRDLKVPARTSTFKFRGTDLDIGEIALQLNVAHVLEGSVRRAGNRVRINAQLIDADTGYQLWSDNYDRELDDIFAIQDEISGSIVAALREVLGIDKTQPLPLTRATASTDAYNEYLLGQHLMHQRSKASIEQAAQHFERAQKMDADYAPAFAAGSIAWMLLQDSFVTYGDLPLQEAVARALPPAQRALELDPNLAEAHAAMGFIHFQQQQFEETLSYWDRAIELNPNYALVYSWRSIILQRTGQYKGQLDSVRAAAELDPLSVNVLNNYASALFARGRYEESDRVMQRIKAIAPNMYNYRRSWQAWQRGSPSEATFALLDGLEFDPDDRRIPGGLTNMFGLLGFHDESLRHASEALRYLPYQWISDWETLLDIAQVNYSANPDNRSTIAALGQAFLASGDREAATPHLEQYVRGFGDGIGPNVLLAGYVALIRQANGDLDGAQEILDPLKARYERAMAGGLDTNNNRLTDALISLLEGREADALTALATLGTGVEPQVAASLRLLTSLKDNPLFDEILEKQAAHFAEEREKLLTRICDENGWENWKPLPNTCES